MADKTSLGEDKEDDTDSPNATSDSVPFVTMPSQESDDAGDLALPGDGRCGWFCCKPQWLQFFNRPKCFLVCLCLFVLCQGVTVSGEYIYYYYYLY